MEKKHFVINLAIQIDAEDENQVLEVLSSEEALHNILQAIVANKDHIQEIREDKNQTQLLN